MASNGSSLFGGSGGLGASATQSNSLFSGNKPAAGSFSGLGAPSTQASQPQSLFGGQPPAQQQPTQSSFLGQTQQPVQSSLLGQTQQPNTAQTHGQPPIASTQPAFFNSLLERGKKRPLSSVGQNNNFEDVPSLQLGLDDIRRKARELGTAGQKDASNGANSKA
jgi:nuclear pore complex protein Nup93